jgi:hypothetical protein
LQTHKNAIKERWLDKTLESYPNRTSTFFRRKRNRFANPVGHALRSGIEALVDELFAGLEEPGAVSADRMCDHLESIIKIRSVQDFAPSQVISFVFYLKRAIREELEIDLQDEEMMTELADFEAQIDQLALLAVDIYVKCREKLYELRVNEIKRTGFRLLKKANLISIDEDPEPEEDWALTNITRPRGGGP